MLITVGVMITTAVILANACALADILDSGDLLAPVARAWVAAVVLAPGLGAAMWFAQRSTPHSDISRRGTARLKRRLTGRDLAQMHSEIEAFLAREA